MIPHPWGNVSIEESSGYFRLSERCLVQEVWEYSRAASNNLTTECAVPHLPARYSSS